MQIATVSPAANARLEATFSELGSRLAVIDEVLERREVSGDLATSLGADLLQASWDLTEARDKFLSIHPHSKVGTTLGLHIPAIAHLSGELGLTGVTEGASWAAGALGARLDAAIAASKSAVALLGR